jgi:hypothetical protein
MSDKDATLDAVMDWLSITKANEHVLVPAVGLGPEDFACAERIRAAHPPAHIDWWDEWERGLATLRAAGVTHVGIARELAVIKYWGLSPKRANRRRRRARINRRGWA